MQVPVPSPDTATSRLCAGLRLPEKVHGEKRRDTSPGSPLTAAWGSPAIALRCGVPRPATLEPTSELVTINGIDWFGMPADRPVTFTAVGRQAYVEVTVPPKYNPAGRRAHRAGPGDQIDDPGQARGPDLIRAPPALRPCPCPPGMACRPPAVRARVPRSARHGPRQVGRRPIHDGGRPGGRGGPRQGARTTRGRGASSPMESRDVPESVRSLAELFQRTAGARAGQIALRSSDGAVELTWRQYTARVRRIAGGLASLGVRHGDTVALMLTNRPEFHLADTAALHLGATPFSVYNTSPPSQIAHLFSNAATGSW
ncbi:DUF3515 domain-containing protein [Actinomadura madurae]|uniref:DUF3515 domain-containing protein n=1 Tax=Actinomadura madurae TaxID=1993 RepID=UPI0020D22E6D|nr:DUF3515 family protein [Actinomadura madurae]